MTMLLGAKSRFAVEIGDEWWGDILRRVGLWLADQYLTCDDDFLFVRSIGGTLPWAAERVRSGMLRGLPFAGLSAEETHRRLVAMRASGEADDDLYFGNQFLEWGPTTDNVTVFAFRCGDRVAITAEFWREEHLREHPEHVGRVFVAELEAVELAGILTDLADVLQRDPTRPAGAPDLSAAES